ncbi:MAG: EpsI family protein [Candidatus Omnitrophica bacterium]|nr:EpsI family protein [Candidatus Omnitrophota bacterium]
MNNRNFIIIVLILILVVYLSLASYLPTRTDATSNIKVSDFPKEFGEWTSTDIPISENDYAILETRNLFVREYKNKQGQSVYLYLIYSEDNRKVSHPPEICLLGSGMTIVEKDSIQLTSPIKAMKLIVEKEKIPQMYIYWFKAGNVYTDNYIKQQMKIVIDRMLGKRTAGAMIRISTDLKTNDKEEAFKLLKSFSNEISPLLAKYIP